MMVGGSAQTFLLHLLMMAAACLVGAQSGSCPSSVLPTSPLSPTTCSSTHISSSLRATAACKPRDKVVKVPWPTNSSYDQLTPSHVTVKRCSGGCHGGSTSCVPTATSIRKVAVLLARCPLGGGSCDKECATVEVEDEVACGCGCRLEPSSCRSEDQEWREETCSCQCLCPPTSPCPPDQTHDPSSCSCLPLGLLEGQERQERQERQEDVLQLNWEHPVILTLASLNLLLISIIVVLVRKHRKMTRRLREQPSHVPGEMSKNLYSPPPRNATEPPSLKAALLYTSDSDVSTEQQNTNTDSSYCSDATYRPSPQPSYSPPTEVTYRPSPLPSYASSPYPSPPYSSLVPPTPYPCCSYPSLSSLPVPSSECGQCNSMARNRLPPSECNTIVRIAGGGGNGTL